VSTSRPRPQVAITGIGIVSAIGCGRGPFWTALADGRSGVTSTEGVPCLTAPVGDFDGRRWIDGALARRMDRLSQMLVAATQMAVVDAGLDPPHALPPERTAIVTGTALGNLSETAAFLSRLGDKGPALASPSLFPNLVMNASASYAAMAWRVTGPTLTVSEGDISGELAVAAGYDLIAAGAADVALVGGVDELTAVRTPAYWSLGLLAPAAAHHAWSGPFGRGGPSVALGEGAAILVLEAIDRARARGRPAYAEIVGCHPWAVQSPAHGWPAGPAPIAAEIHAALGLLTEPVDAIFSGAPGRPDQDALELSAYAYACRGSPPPWVTSVKGATGDFGAAGAVSVAAAALAVAEQTITPLCRLDTPPVADGVRLAGTTGTTADLHHVLVSGLTYGGNGIGIALRRSHDPEALTRA
jgi:3-oxoacyl-[acyl-carrier-protein] synthase II